MAAATFTFAVQDAISKHLAATYNLPFTVMLRYWFFAAFVLWLAARSGGIGTTARTRRPRLQIARGLVLAAEVWVTVTTFVLLGLAQSHAVFAIYPLLTALLAVPILGERLGPRRWVAIIAGAAGVLLIVGPGVSGAAATLPLFGAVLFALYSVLTRLAAADDGPVTNLFWTGLVGAVAMTALGLPAWEPLARADWGWMAALCLTGVLSHWLLIKCYAVAEAASVQPFAYLHLVFATAIGVLVFAETLAPVVVVGAAVIVAAGCLGGWPGQRASSSAASVRGTTSPARRAR